MSMVNNRQTQFDFQYIYFIRPIPDMFLSHLYTAFTKLRNWKKFFALRWAVCGSSNQICSDGCIRISICFFLFIENDFISYFFFCFNIFYVMFSFFVGSFLSKLKWEMPRKVVVDVFAAEWICIACRFTFMLNWKRSCPIVHVQCTGKCWKCSDVFDGTIQCVLETSTTHERSQPNVCCVGVDVLPAIYCLWPPKEPIDMEYV